MIFWILYGALVLTKGNVNNIILPRPLLFKTELKCLRTKQLNEDKFINEYNKVDLICAKIEVEK